MTESGAAQSLDEGDAVKIAKNPIVLTNHFFGVMSVIVDISVTFRLRSEPWPLQCSSVVLCAIHEKLTSFDTGFCSFPRENFGIYILFVGFIPT